MKIRFRFVSLFLIWILPLTLTHPFLLLAESSAAKGSDLAVLQNILDSLENRRNAMTRLLVAPTEALYETMLTILQNPKETIPMKHNIAEGLVQTRDRFILRQIERIAFSQTDDNGLARELCLSILWRATTQNEKERLSEEFLKIAKNTRESDNLRRAAIGYLSNAKINFEHEPNWADALAINQKESVAVRTAALNYMEVLEFESLTPIMSDIINDTSENQAIREITILKVVRLQIDTFKPDLESILLNQKDNFEIRKMCLNMLIHYGFSMDTELFLKQMLASEKNEEMKNSLQTSLAELAEEK